MTNPQKAKGDRAELKAAALLTEALGLRVCRLIAFLRNHDHQSQAGSVVAGRND